jgi:hypothetical protein
MYRAALAIAALLVSSCGTATSTNETPKTNGPPVQSGKLDRWPEATKHLSVAVDASGTATVGLVDGRPEGLGAFWSLATTKGAGSGFFYSAPLSGDSEVARASVSRVQEIVDATQLDWSHESIGPIPEGDIVVMRHPATGRYMALVIDAIDAVDPRTTSASPWAYANVTWYLAAEGSADFSAAP